MHPRCRSLIDQPELAYVMARYREIHDFLHVLTGLPPTVEGELALKTLEAVQTGLPMAALSALGGPLSLRDPRRIARWYIDAAPAVNAWATICGRRSLPVHLLVRCEHLCFSRSRLPPASPCISLPALSATQTAALVITVVFYVVCSAQLHLTSRPRLARRRM